MLEKSIITSETAETRGACGKPFRPSLTTSPRHRPVMMTHPFQIHSTIFIHRLCLSPVVVRKTLSRINPRCGSWQHTWPCTERLCWTADRCPNRYIQHLTEPGSHPHMSQIHNNLAGTKEIICVLSKRLPWTSGKTLVTTPHWPSTAWLWRESAALNSWGCTSQSTSPGPPTLYHSPRRRNSAYTLSAGWKEQVSLHPSSPLSTGEPLRVCWPAASLYGTGTVVQQTAKLSNRQWTQLQRSLVPFSPPSWIFSLHDAPEKQIVSWRTPPTVSFSSYHQEDGAGASEPAPPDCSTAFPPRLWEPWT